MQKLHLSVFLSLCGSSIVQLKELQMKVRNADDFFTFVKAQKAVDTRLQDLLSYLPENRLAIVLSRATLGNLYQAVSQLQILYYYSDGMKEGWKTEQTGSC